MIDIRGQESRREEAQEPSRKTAKPLRQHKEGVYIMSMKLVILGLLMEGNRHPYEIRQTMKDRAMHHYVKMQEGSLYYAIDQLKKDGYIEPVEVVKDSSRPDRTIYTITAAGEELFQELLLLQFGGKKQVFHPMSTALVFAKYGDQKKIELILQRKLKEQHKKVKELWEVYEEHIPKVPRSVLHLMMSGYEHGMAELRWLERLIQDAREERLGQFGEALDLKAYHHHEE